MVITEEDAPELHRYLHDSNLLRQYDLLKTCVRVGVETGNQHPSHQLLFDLNHAAAVYLSEHPGRYRPHDVKINNSEHRPPSWTDVGTLTDEFLQTLRQRWDASDPLWLAAFCLWRINWIHPFAEGNGRTARAVCYYVLCVKFGMWLPGANIIPQQIRANRQPYYRALARADRAFGENGSIELPDMYDYLSGLLKAQLETA